MGSVNQPTEICLRALQDKCLQLDLWSRTVNWKLETKAQGVTLKWPKARGQTSNFSFSAEDTGVQFCEKRLAVAKCRTERDCLSTTIKSRDNNRSPRAM
jgi:hypothetical protein